MVNKQGQTRLAQYYEVRESPTPTGSPSRAKCSPDSRVVHNTLRLLVRSLGLRPRCNRRY